MSESSVSLCRKSRFCSKAEGLDFRQDENSSAEIRGKEALIDVKIHRETGSWVGEALQYVPARSTGSEDETDSP